MRVSKGYSLERGFISKLIETKDMKLIKDLQITTLFLTGEHKKVFKFICDQYRENGEIPTQRVLKRKFPNYSLEYYDNDKGDRVVGTEETLRYWCTELRTKAKHNKLADYTEDIAKLLDEGKTQDAYELMQKGVWVIEGDINEHTTVDITKDTEDRKKAYLERKKNKGMLGIPTGIPHLDYITKGLVNETLTTVIAQTGVGKTWLLVLLGAYAQLNGYKVCCFVTEMSTEQMRDRFEAMLYGMMYRNFDYNKFKSGSLDDETERKYFEFLDEDLPRLEPLIIETANGVSSVVSVVERENPDLILIDSAYLMEDEQGAKEDWARITHITRDLKKTAKALHKPIVINTQADQNTSKKNGPGLSDIKYTQAIGQDSDLVMSLFRDEIMLEDKEMGLRVLKQREGTLGKVYLNWDFSTMNFNSIYSDTDGEEDRDNYNDGDVKEPNIINEDY